MPIYSFNNSKETREYRTNSLTTAVSDRDDRSSLSALTVLYYFVFSCVQHGQNVPR
jgi:hypothetical protein